MAKANLTSLKKPKAPKKPKLTASKTAFDSYEKRKKEYDSKVKAIDSEITRRKKVISK